ncbi:MAG: MFS transporter [Thermoflavifilum sp.]|nr:MFS transporter [Thermoflavifilum sp.]MCL6514829.1 MFS transporter [Alicyclobacillus sp.]
MRAWTKTLSYTSGSIPANLLSLAFTTYAQFYYIDILKGDPAAIGTVATIQAAYATLVYPLLGWLSDRTRSRWGRRVPYIVYGSLPLCAAFALVWAPPMSAASRWAFALYFLAVAVLYDTLFNVVMMNWSALFPDLFRSVRERGLASAAKQLFGIIGLVMGLALPPMLAQAVGWPSMGLAFAVLSAITLVTTFPSYGLFSKRAQGQPVTLPDSSPDALPFFASLRQTLWNRSFFTFVGMRFFVQFAFTLLTADLSYYAKYNLGISGTQQSLLLFGTLVVALILVYAWGWVVPHWGAFRTEITAMALFAAGLVWLAFVHTYTAALACGMALGIGLAGILILTDVLISDVIDEDELRFGSRREGMYYATHGLIVSLCAPAQSLITTLVLVNTGYTHTGPQPALAMAGFRWLVTVIPLISLVVGLLFFLGYPLRKRRVEEIQQQLRTARAAQEE